MGSSDSSFDLSAPIKVDGISLKVFGTVWYDTPEDYGAAICVGSQDLARFAVARAAQKAGRKLSQAEFSELVGDFDQLPPGVTVVDSSTLWARSRTISARDLERDFTVRDMDDSDYWDNCNGAAAAAKLSRITFTKLVSLIRQHDNGDTAARLETYTLPAAEYVAGVMNKRKAEKDIVRKLGSEVVRQAISIRGGDVDRIRAIIKSISDRANLILDEPDRAKRYFKIFPKR
jgi:hypothetical protein